MYFTQIPEQEPNYIFPLYSPQVCGTQNINQLMYMLYRPLYWYGNNYRPTIDYDYSIGQRPQFSGGGKTVTIKLNTWKWADGESLTSRVRRTSTSFRPRFISSRRTSMSRFWSSRRCSRIAWRTLVATSAS